MQCNGYKIIILESAADETFLNVLLKTYLTFYVIITRRPPLENCFEIDLDLNWWDPTQPSFVGAILESNWSKW